MLDNEQNYDIIMVLRATRKKKDKKHKNLQSF